MSVLRVCGPSEPPLPFRCADPAVNRVTCTTPARCTFVASLPRRVVNRTTPSCNSRPSRSDRSTRPMRPPACLTPQCGLGSREGAHGRHRSTRTVDESAPHAARSHAARSRPPLLAAAAAARPPPAMPRRRRSSVIVPIEAHVRLSPASPVAWSVLLAQCALKVRRAAGRTLRRGGRGCMRRGRQRRPRRTARRANARLAMRWNGNTNRRTAHRRATYSAGLPHSSTHGTHGTPACRTRLYRA